MRAVKTAEPLKVRHSVPFVIAPEIQEMHFGVWESLVFSDIQTRWPDLYQQWMKDPFSVKIPDAEMFSDFFARIKTFSEILGASKENQIAIVAHAGVLSVLTLQLLNQPTNQFWSWISPNAAITVLKRNLSEKSSPFELVKKHDVQHLAEFQNLKPV